MSFKYDPNRTVDPEAWLALDEDLRDDLVIQYHSRTGIEVPNLDHHSLFHVLVENQIAQDVPEVRNTLSRLMEEGLDRHDSVHAIATVSSELMFDLRKAKETPTPESMELALAERLRELSAESWYALADAVPNNGPWNTDISTRNPTGPLERAQELVSLAFDEPEADRRVQMAKEALEISSDCVDAYVLLAEEPNVSFEEAEGLYRKGIEAGERNLGEEVFEEDAGYFWGLIETRPYMRARAGLAEVLLFMGREGEAIEHMKELVRLNPNDNQGIRSRLMPCLFDQGRIEELSDLLEQFGDDILPSTLYTRTLCLYSQKGDCEEARRELRRAVKVNPFVPSFLLGKRKFPKMLPEFLTVGSLEEAAEYAIEGLHNWRSTPGALFWLRRFTSKKKRG